MKRTKESSLFLLLGGAIIMGTIILLAMNHTFEEEDFDFDTSDEHDGDYL